MKGIVVLLTCFLSIHDGDHNDNTADSDYNANWSMYTCLANRDELAQFI